VVIALAVAGILAIYWRTAASIVSIWDSSQTYAHGYVIVPLALFLVWRKRYEVATVAPRPDYAGLVLGALAGFAWLVGAAGDVQIVQQYAMVAMIPAAVVAVAGREAGRVLAFPLAFLLFAVPFGEGFVPHLMDWTADFAVGALQLTGIPVYREGTFFELPSGRWSVVEACSGVRYLIASVTVGALYAYLTYRSLWKRAAFLAVSIVVPVLANFVRAYMIVMIGHLSSMKLAVGVDHLIYGWLFFGFVILVLFWLGSWWRDPPAIVVSVPALTPPRASYNGRFVAAGASAVLLAAPWPVYAAHVAREDTSRVALAFPAPAAGWVADESGMTDWRPSYSGAKATLFEVYRKGDRAVALYLGYYRGQRQGAELVSWQNVLVASSDPTWSRVGETGREERLAGDALVLRQTRLRSPRQRLLVWDWYRVAGRDTSNPYLAKALLARERLLSRDDDSIAIILATPYDVRAEGAQQTLREFATEMLPSIDAALARARKP